RQPKSLQLRYKPQNLFHELAESRRARKVSTISREVDACQYDFGEARMHQSPGLLHDRAHRHAARVSAPERNDAEGAAMITAILYLQKGTGASLEAVDILRRRLAHAHDVVDADAFRSADAEIGVAFSQKLFLIADDGIDLCHAGEGLWLSLCRT